MTEFKEFPKIFRYSRDVVVTEKLDGTNACVVILENGSVHAQSRSRIITPEDDNYGFAKWVKSHETKLIETLGEGYHYGEWWGQGIQRGYNMKRKIFSLFNVSRWSAVNDEEIGLSVVPTLWKGSMDKIHVESIMDDLEKGGSVASLGFIKPEGIVIYHTQGNFLLKKTFEKDKDGKTYGA